MRLSHLVVTVILLSAVVVPSGCSSGQPADNARIEVGANVPGPLFFGSGISAPTNIDVMIANHGAEPIRINTIQLTTPGMLEYQIRAREKIVQETIGPGEMKVISIQATAIASTTTQPTEPLMLRAAVDYTLTGARHRQFFNIRLPR